MFLFIKIDFKRTTDSRASLHERAHPTQYVVRNESSSVEVSIRRREAYPRTYCRQTSSDTFEVGYDQQPEFLKILVNGSGAVYVERDAYATLPLFYGYSDGVFAISNVYEEVVCALPSVSVCKQHLLRSLSPYLPSLHTTPVNEVQMLTERESLECDDNGPRLHIPVDRSWVESRDAPPSKPHDFLNTFESHLEHFVKTRLHGQRFALEVSGGLDSATLPLFLRRNYEDSPLMAGVMFPGEFRVSQMKKLQIIAKATNYQLLTEPIDETRDFPLARMIASGLFHPFHDAENIYAEPFIRHANNLKKQGVTVLATGVGGDDICENIVDRYAHYGFGISQQQAVLRRQHPPYLTAAFREAYGSMVAPLKMHHAVPLQAMSSVANGPGGNNIYIEHDVWPVSPFLEPKLYEFVQGLPAHFRANKNILRAYHKARKGIPEIYDCTDSEHFGVFFDQSFQHNELVEKAIRTHLPDSIAVRQGYIDPDALLAEYHQEGAELYPIYRWLASELSLRYTPTLKQ